MSGKVKWSRLWIISSDGEVMEHNRITGEKRVFYDPTAYNNPNWEPNPQPIPPEMKALLKRIYELQPPYIPVYDPAEQQNKENNEENQENK